MPWPEAPRRDLGLNDVHFSKSHKIDVVLAGLLHKDTRGGRDKQKESLYVYNNACNLCKEVLCARVQIRKRKKERL